MITSRLWHYQLVPYLSTELVSQLKSNLTRIIRDWQLKGWTEDPRQNLLLRQYPGDVKIYLQTVYEVYWKRRNKQTLLAKDRVYCELQDFLTDCESLYLDYYKFQPDGFFAKWHTEEYLNICMTELYEFFKYSYGTNRIVGKEWDYYQRSYKKITGHDFCLGAAAAEPPQYEW